MVQRREFLGLVTGGATAALAGCSLGRTASSDAAVRNETLTLTTTTSTYDTGLLGEVNSAFTQEFGAEVDAVAQGTGAALETARNGDSDVVLVHARSLEDDFLREGFGVNRRDLMFNDFVVVGPESDPAGIDGLESATEAFQAIASSESTFVSRGDNSGTHTKERVIWEQAGVEPGGEWYRETGSGMGEALNQANLSGAYTLSDRGTFISQQSEVGLGIRVQGPIEDGPALLSNPYGVMAVNPAVHENVNYSLAMAYIGFITSPDGQQVIAEYTVDGQQLFFPRALSKDPDFQQYVPEGWSSDK